MTRGIDVSHYQLSVDWAGLTAKHHLSFGAAKASEGTSFVDSYFAQNWKRMKAAGLRRIAYHYATPSASSARTQAAKLVALADPQPGDALCLDLEKSNLSQSATNSWMQSFGDSLRDLAPGITTIAYLGGYAANGSGRQAVDHFDRWWYPRYASMSPASSWPTSCNPRVDTNTTGWPHPPAPHIWQWTPNLGGMDANVSDLTVAQLFDQEDQMPTAAEIVDALLSRQVPNPLAKPGDPQTVSVQTHLVWGNSHAAQARDLASAALAILNGSNAAGLKAFAQAVVAELPDNPGGGPSADEVAAAVAAKFSTLLGGAVS